MAGRLPGLALVRRGHRLPHTGHRHFHLAPVHTAMLKSQHDSTSGKMHLRKRRDVKQVEEKSGNSRGKTIVREGGDSGTGADIVPQRGRGPGHPLKTMKTM